MNQKIVVLLFMLILVKIGYTQETDANNKNRPVENLTVHLTQECIFPGETMWFKIYCTSPLFPETELSRMAYIELVSQDNASLLRKKILLTKGQGGGEFTFPEDIPTGIYYILAYTNWMKNFGESTFFVKSVTVINPNEKFEYFEINDDFKSESGVVEGKDESIKVIPNKSQYLTREKVALVIENSDVQEEMNEGNYSVSVMRKAPKMHAEIKFNSNTNNSFIPDSIINLPDYKGIRLSGNIADESSEPVKGELISVSYPGPGTDIDGTKTDEKGNFNFLLEPEVGEKDILFKLPSDNLKLKLEESFRNGFRNPPVATPLQLSQNAASFLTERNDHFQLQQKFNQQNVKKNNPVVTIPNSNYRFYGDADQIIEMNEYIELDSLTEYFWELIPTVKFTPRRGNFNISIIDPITFYPFKDPPGVFVDGVLYNNFNEIADMPVEMVRQLAVVDKTYYYREFTFGGIVDIHTKQNNFKAVKLQPDMIRMMYPLGSPIEAEFINIEHSETDTLARIPDLRYLLCWNPEVELSKDGKTSVEFYASDVEGDYVVKVVGISADGNIIECETEITVKANLK